MSELPISSPYRSSPHAPVTEAERNQLSARLNAAYEAGALSSDDFGSRLDRLFAAQRMGELVPVVEGLPALPTYQGPSFAATGAPGQLSDSRNATRLTIAVIAILAAVVTLIAVLLVILL